MSLLNTILVKLGLSNTPANNFVLDASADNGTMKLARGNPGATTQDILTVDAAGKVDFALGLFGFEYGASGVARRGYIKVPVWLGGWVLQWGSITFTASAATNVGYLKPFTDLSSIVGVASQNNGFTVGNYAVSTDFGVSLTLISAWIPSAQTVGYNFIAVGK